MKNRAARYSLGFLLLAVMAAVMFMAELMNGSSSVTAGEALSALTGSAEDTARRIILDIRLPRALSALILGGALSVSGFLLQSFFANPIAGPFVLGISSGAKLIPLTTTVLP